MSRLPLAVLLSLTVLAAGCANGSGDSDADSTLPTPPASPSTTGAITPPATASGSPAPPVSPVAVPLTWRGCGAGFSCTTMAVPLDEADLSKGSVSLAVTRRPATRPEQRLGALLVNPGGPGASAVNYLRAAYDGMTSEVRARFDLVAFDPRGVGGSAPVRCATTRELDRFFAVDPEPDSAAELTTLERASADFGRGCQRRSGRVLGHVSTATAARDMERLRIALREPQLNYLGYSYGTAIGASYLDQFPANVRTMVLDGALDPSMSWDEVLAGQARGFDGAMRSFLAWCESHRSQCAFRQEVRGDLGAAFDQIAAKVDRSPLRGYGGRTVGPAEFSYGTGQALYSTSLWPTLGQALQQANRGSGGQLLALSDNYLDRSDDGYRNTIEANFAVNCLDRPWPRETAPYLKLAERVRADSPRFGPAIALSGIGCAEWPVASVGTPRRVTGTGSPAVIVIGTTRDPATPYAWSVALADQLDQGVLLTYDGDGHTVYRGGAPSCIRTPVDTYFVTGRAPTARSC
ncbi:MAG TPA: alpha/beta hydrolase [Mycobacteriales bacterium]|nr:alpha/beta hydrolase [Mycobacteriales bacterium]